MTVVALIATAIAFYAAILVGEWLRSGARELFDEPRSNGSDGLGLGGPDNLKSSFHSSANSGEAQR